MLSSFLQQPQTFCEFYICRHVASWPASYFILFFSHSISEPLHRHTSRRIGSLHRRPSIFTLSKMLQLIIYLLLVSQTHFPQPLISFYKRLFDMSPTHYVSSPVGGLLEEKNEALALFAFRSKSLCNILVSLIVKSSTPRCLGKCSTLPPPFARGDPLY